MRALLLCLGFLSANLTAQDFVVTLSDSDRLVACQTDQETCDQTLASLVEGLADPQAVVRGNDERLYVTSGARSEILRLQPDGRFVEIFVSTGSGGLLNPMGLVFGPDGHLYVASSGNHAVLRFNGESGAFIDAFVATERGGLQDPRSLTFGPDGDLYVLSGSQASVLRFDGESGAFVEVFLASGTGGMVNPQWLGFAPDDFLYITDANLNQVLRFAPTTRTLWDVFIQEGLNQPRGASFDVEGSLYVANSGNNEISIFWPSGVLDQRISVSGSPSSVLSPVIEKASTAAKLIYPWVSNNEGFESILVAHNYSPVPAVFRLSARRSSGPAEVVEQTIPAHGFLRQPASTLFPLLGNGAGYAVTLESSVPQISGVWVTNNLTAASGKSPAQGVAVEMPSADNESSPRWGNRIAFGFLPTTEGLTSAPVVVNLGEEATDVVLQFYDAAGTLILEDRDTLQGLTPLRPFAAVVNQLIPANSGDVYVIAYAEDQPLTGVSFVFNDGGEPAIGNVTSVDDRFTPVNQKVQWLQDNAVTISSTDPAEDDFSDLQYLAEALDGVRVVMLGEQTHGDGTTFLAKARIIKYLHQELGFDVLAFESPMFDCRKAWQAFQAGTEPRTAFTKGVFGIWSSSQQLQPMIDYLAESANTDRPLELAGFDSQFNGNDTSSELGPDLESFLTALGAAIVNHSDWGAFMAELNGITTIRYVNEGAPDKTRQQAFFNTLAEINRQMADLIGDAPNDEEKFWQQMLASLETHAQRVWLFDYVNRQNNTTTVRNMRDEQMGRNLVWMANEMYPDRKIIAWAATFHIARNMPEHFRRTDTGGPIYASNQVTMGDIVYQDLGDVSYAMGFTAFEGNWGTVFTNTFDVSAAESEDLEFLFHQAGFTNAFIDFRTSAPNSEWLRQPFISKPLGYVRVGGDWSQILDGMVYTQTMIPSEIISTKRGSAKPPVFLDLRTQ
jgi:erythromycin esterase